MHKNAGSFCCCVSIIFASWQVTFSAYRGPEHSQRWWEAGFWDCQKSKSRVSFDLSWFRCSWMFSTDSLIFEGHTMQNLQASFCWAPNFPTAVHQMPPGPLTPLDVCNIGRFVPLLPARFSRFPMWAMASCVEKQEDVLKRPCLLEGLFLFFFLSFAFLLNQPWNLVFFHRMIFRKM